MTEITAQLQTPDEVRKTAAKNYNITQNQATGNLNIPEFFSQLYAMLQIDLPQAILVPSFPKYLRPGTPEFQKTMDNPTELFSPTITYEVVRREFGTMGGNKQPFGTGFKEITPKARKRVAQPDGTQVVVYGQNYDNLIRFDIWSLSNFEAEALFNFFEQYLTDKRSFLRNLGLGEIFLWTSGKEGETPALDNGLESRKLIFYVRTEELSLESEKILKNIELQMSFKSSR